MVLALVMVFGMMPMQVFATGTGDAPLEQVETPTEAPTAAPTEATEHVHVYGEAVTTAATCTADGVKTFTCTCGDSYTEVIAAPGHAYENGVCACGETEPTEAPTEPPVMAPAPTEDPVQSLIDSLPASVNSKAEYDAVYNVVAQIENNGYDLSADQLDAVFAAMNAADEWYGAEESADYAEADGWYWVGNTLYIKNGKITKYQLYNAVHQKQNSSYNTYKYAASKPSWGWGSAGTEINSNSSTTEDAGLSRGNLAIGNKSTKYSWTGGATTNYTVEYYYIPSFAVTGNDDVEATITNPTNGKVIHGDSITFTLPAMGETGWTATVEGLSEAVSLSKDEVTTVTVESIASADAAAITVALQQAVIRNVTLDNATPNYGEASIDKESGIDGTVVTVTATPKEASGHTGYVLESITVNGDSITGNTFTINGADANVVVTFATETFDLSGSDYEIKINGFSNETKAVDLKKLVLDEVIGGDYNADDYKVEMLSKIEIGSWSSEDYYNIEGETLDLGWLGKHEIDAEWFVTQLKVDGTTKNDFKVTKLASANECGQDLYRDKVYIIATEFRTPANITLPVTDYTENTLADVIAAIKGNVLVNGESANVTVVLSPETALTTEKQTYTASVTAPETEDYLENTKEFTITADISTYTVTWVADGIPVDTETVVYGGKATKSPAVPAKEGHTGEWVGATTEIKNDTTITATYTINSYTVTWTINGNQYGEASSFEYGAAVTAPAYEIPEGYTFTTWVLPEKMPAANIVLDAALTVNQYDVIWQWNVVADGKVTTKTVTDNTKFFGDAITPHEIPADEKSYVVTENGETTYYNFEKWVDTEGNALKTGDTVLVGGNTYKAAYTNKPVFTVTYDSNGGSDVNPENVIEGKTAEYIEPIREGYRFDGWYLKGEKFDFNTAIIDDITLTAKWVKQYTVTYTSEHHADKAPAEKIYDVDTEITIADLLAVGDKTDSVIMDGWYIGEEKVSGAYTVTTDVEIVAKWLADENNNEVVDEKETVTVTIVGNGSVNGNTGNFEALYDSVNETTISLKAVPVIEEGSSKSYVSSIAANGAELELEYTDYCVELDAPVEGHDVVVTFTDCGFVYDEDGKMRFYVGMENPNYETLYKAVVVTPEYSEQFVTAKYLARPAATYKMQVPVLFEYTVPLINYDIKIGGNEVELDLDDAWLDVGESFKTLTPEQLQVKYDTEIQKIKDKIAAIDLSDISWDNADDKIRQFAAIRDELTTLIETISNEAEYLGYHQFGASDLVDEDGNVQEILQIVYDNGAMHLQNEEVRVTLEDDRTPTVLTGGDVTVEYDEYNNDSLLPAIKLTTADGTPVNGEVKILVDMSGKNVGEYTYTAEYAGSWDYKPATATFTLTVVKAPSNVDVLNQNITYGTTPSAPVITNKHGKVIDIDTIEFIIGLDVAELDVDGDGVKGLEGKLQLVLTEELQTILSMVGLENGAELNINELISALTNTGLLEQWGISGGVVDTLKQALDSINGIVEANNLLITIGGGYPTNIGAYLHGAVTVDANYETAFDVGYIIIRPDASRVYLDWNYNATDGLFTPALLEQYNLSASAYDDAAFETLNTEASQFVNNLFFGLDVKGELVAKFYNADIDPETIESELDNGAYTQMAFAAKFGNKLYYSVPIVRAFAIIPNLMDVQVVVDGAEIADLYTTVFDGAPVDVTANLTVAKGAKIPGDGEVKFHYYGIKTNTETYDSDVAPTNAGAYAITATYQTVDENGKTTALGVDVAVLVIEPTTSTIKVENKIGAQDAGTKHYFGDQIKAASAVEGLKPDTTIMTAGINTDGSFSENGWDAVTGTVNVDFPRWVDALIAQYAPSVLEGVTLQEFSDKLLGKLPEITEKMEEIGATNEMVNSLKHAVTNVSKALEKMPKNVELSFNDNAYATGVGAYVIVGIVTDSDHIPSMDAGILVLTPDVETVELKWNYEDENHIWTRELLKLKDLKAKAFDLKTGAYSEAATEKITYQFIGIDKNGELVVVSTTNPDELPNGAYIELAYIGLAVDGAMTCSNLIARDLLIVPNTAEVTFVDANNNNARIFTFDNTPKAMEVQIVVNGAAVEPAEGELTLTYMGVQTNTKTYNSTTAPTHAGVYTIVAEYRSYTTEGSLAHIGSAVGMMAIAPAASTMDVTGDTVTYDGEGHTATVKATGSGVTEPDYTLISGGAYVSGDINKVGVDAFHGNVNIDFPAWLDKALAEHEFAAEGVNTTYLIEFISAYRDDVLALIPAEKLAQLGIETEKVNAIIEKLNAYIDELLAILEKLPKNVILTFKDDVTYTEPGYYFYYGIVTDSDHYPASDTGLLVIEKKPLVFDLLNTTATWNGNGQMVDLNNPENADFTTVVIDRKHNTINILLDEDAQYALNAVAKILGVEFDGDVQISTIIEKYNGEELAAAIVELIGQLEQLELSEDVHKALAAVKKELETLPETGTIMINGDLPTELGKYEVYGLSYAQYFETAAAEAVLEIVPVQVEVILDNITKAYGEADPALTYTVNYYDHLGNKLDDAGVVDVTVTREEGEHVGTYAISAVAKLNDDAHYVLIAQPESATFEITKAEDNGWSEEPSIAGWTYGEEPNEPTGAAKYGEIKVEYRPADGSDADFTETVPTDAGDYVVRFTVEGTDNYNGITIEKELSIEKAASEIKDAPEAVKNLTYTGDAQELITAGTAEGGKVVYSLSEEGPFTNQIPAGTDADKYIVYYKVEGDENHTDTEVKHVEVTISKATPDVKAPAGLTAVEGQTLADVKLPEGFAWANAETTSVGEPGENKFVAIFTPADSKNYEAVRVEVIITVEEDNSKDGLYPIRMKADHETIAAGAKIYVDGVAYELDEDLIAYVPMDNATFVTTYVYNKQSSDTHEVYPTHMYVWQLTFSGEKDEQWVEGENYTAKRIAEFDDIMQYAGSSIRISGKKGIRMITSVPTAKRNTLIKSNLLGWRLMQTGTCVEWADENGVIYNSLTMNTNPKLTGYAYKRGVQDPVFARTNGLDQFTNVLVGFNNDQCKLDLVMRPYMILENVQTGETAVLYGGMVQRSIGYIAYQNRLVYKPGNAAYNFIWDIIHHVYGNKYDADFKG